MSGGRPKPSAATRAGVSSEDAIAIFYADIEKEVKIVLEANQSFLNAEQSDIFHSLAYVNAQQLVALLLNLVKEASVVPQPKPSPSRNSVIVPTDSSFKLMSSPCDPEFFVPFKESFNESKIPEFWQHFRGNLLAAPDGRIGCAGCCVEAVVSTNGYSLVCPKRSQFESAKRAQEQGCFFILKARCAELTVTKQEDILLYNSSKCSKTVKKTSELAKEILATKRKLDD
jgi:hypothetical protein